MTWLPSHVPKNAVGHAVLPNQPLETASCLHAASLLMRIFPHANVPEAMQGLLKNRKKPDERSKITVALRLKLSVRRIVSDFDNSPLSDF